MVLTNIDITIPVNTGKEGAVEVSQELPYRVITRISLLIPRGVEATARTALFYGEEQVFPYRKGKWITGNDETVRDTPVVDLGESTPVINIRGYNTDTSFSHTFYWRIGSEPVEQARWKSALVFLASQRGGLV